MPIPQLNNNNKSQQSWRKTNKTKKQSLQSSFSKNKKTNKSNKNLYSKIKKKLILSILFLAFLLFVFSFLAVAIIARGLPDPNRLIDRELAQTTKIYDRTGETVLYEIHGDQQRTLINLDEIPDHVKWAAIAIEDKNFYKHRGISVWGILRGVVWRKIQGKSVQGGSTLTQQFIKNAVLTNERTVTRKIKEWILAYKLEQKFSKDEILQLYLNEIPYGSTAYGVQAASQNYFGKDVRVINIAEAAILAALPQAPSTYSPYGSNKQLLLNRQKFIIDLMVEQNYISKEDAEDAKDFELVFSKQSTDIKAPHFVMHVRAILSEKYGEKNIEQGGLKIITSLDLYKQEIAEEIVKEMGLKNNENYRASNASLVSIDPKNGQVLAMVGSRNYFDDSIDGQVNVATRLRQPGSSLKPLVYASAFIKGLTPDTILYDVVTNFSNDPNKPYEPKNYSLQENGPVTIKKALAGSLNIPAVKAIYISGIENVLELAKDLGYTSFNDKDRFGLSLVLGGAEVRLLEHTNAYSAFAREGYISPIITILKVEDKNGNTLEEWKEEQRRVLDPKVARAINDILSDNDARAFAFGNRNLLTLGDRPIAAKTGTTNDYRDAWAIGYTPSLVTGVWVGNNDNSEMKRGAAGAVVAAPIWNEYMKRVLGNTPREEFRKFESEKTGKAIIDGIVEGKRIIKIDSISGLLASAQTPLELINEIAVEEHHSILYYIDKNNPLGDVPKNPEKDPQFLLWEGAVSRWAKENASSSDIIIPTEYDNVHTEENKPNIKITSPLNNDHIDNTSLNVTVEASALRGISFVNYYVNNFLLSKSSTNPFSVNENIDFLKNGAHALKAIACDDALNCQEDVIQFNLDIEDNLIYENISLSIIEPSGGIAVSNFDFPLKIKTQNSSAKQVAVINYYYINTNNEKVLIGINQPIGSLVNEITWNMAPTSGSYKVFAEATSWSSQVIKSEELIININNTLDEIKED